jgi:hypothetical protein
MRTSGRSDPDRPRHGGTEDADEPASVRTTPDRGACTCPAKALVAAKRDRRAFSTGSMSSSTLRSLSMVPCTSSFEGGTDEASIRPSRPTNVVRQPAGGGWVPKVILSDAPAVAADLGCHVSSGGVVRPERKSLARSGADALATAPPTEPGAPQAIVTLPSSCISGLLRCRPVRGLVRSRLRGAPNHDRGCRDSWVLAQNAVLSS